MTGSPPGQHDTLREAFAAVYRCKSADFDRRVFWKCLYRHAWLPAYWMWSFEREYFRPDLEAIRSMGSACCEADLQRAIDDFENSGLVERNIRRGRLRIRLSSTRLIALLRPLLPLLKPVATESPEFFAVRSAGDEPRPPANVPARPPASARAQNRGVGGVQMIRTLKRLHGDVVSGRPLEAALAGAGITRAEVDAVLAEFSDGRPDLEWLRGYLAALAELEQLRALAGDLDPSETP